MQNEQNNRIDYYEHRVLFSLDYRSYDNKGVTAVGDPTNTQLTPDVTVHPFTVIRGGVSIGLLLPDNEIARFARFDHTLIEKKIKELCPD